MRYENQEKIKKAARDKKEFKLNIMKEYCLAESFEEFMLNCVVKYGWSSKNLFNKYWWHYKITDIGRHKFIAILTIADILICLGIFGISLLTLSKTSILSQIFSICSIFMTIISPLLIVGIIPQIYKNFHYTIYEVSKRFNKDDENDDQNSCPFTLSL